MIQQGPSVDYWAEGINRSETIIYGDTVIGDNFQTGHNTIREVVSVTTFIGNLSDIQGDVI